MLMLYVLSFICDELVSARQSFRCPFRELKRRKLRDARPCVMQDGRFARMFNQSTTFGAVLDMVTDRCFKIQVPLCPAEKLLLTIRAGSLTSSSCDAVPARFSLTCMTRWSASASQWWKLKRPLPIRVQAIDHGHVHHSRCNLPGERARVTCPARSDQTRFCRRPWI